MAISFADAFNVAAPIYNMAFVAIAVWLFVTLFRTPRAKIVNLMPWKLVFGSLLIFVVEEVLTILRLQGILPSEVRYFNGVFELFIVALFIYALLLQKELSKRAL